MRKNKLSKRDCVYFMRLLSDAQQEIMEHAANGFPENDGYTRSDFQLCVKLIEVGNVIDEKVRKKETE